MKKNLLFAAAAGIMLFSACSNDEDVINGGGANDVNVSGEITLALNAGGSGAESRAARPVYSSEAYSEVTDVELKLFKKNGSDWVAATDVTTDLAEGGQSAIGKPKVLFIPVQPTTRQPRLSS